MGVKGRGKKAPRPFSFRPRPAAAPPLFRLGMGARRGRMSQIEDRLTAAGIVLPQPNAPVANYVPFVRRGELVHISGQVSLDANGGIQGVVGEDIDLDTAVAAARLCG